MKQMALDIGLAPVPTLANFVAAGNEAALGHLRLWAGNPLRSPVPTFLWGEGGSGKTHLLRAVREALRDHGSKVGWIDAATLHPPEYDEHWDAVRTIATSPPISRPRVQLDVARRARPRPGALGAGRRPAAGRLQLRRMGTLGPCVQLHALARPSAAPCCAAC
jgi:hypothetical protein